MDSATGIISHGRPWVSAKNALVEIGPIAEADGLWAARFEVQDPGTEGAELVLSARGHRDPLFGFISSGRLQLEAFGVVKRELVRLEDDEAVVLFLAKNSLDMIGDYTHESIGLVNEQIGSMHLSIRVHAVAPPGYVVCWSVQESIVDEIPPLEQSDAVAEVISSSGMVTIAQQVKATLSGSRYWEAEGTIRAIVNSPSSSINYSSAKYNGTLWTGSLTTVGRDSTSLSRRSGANPINYEVFGYKLH